MSNYDYRFKLILLGASGVGKSSILSRYVDLTFSKTVVSTIGVDFRTKDIKLKRGNKLLNIRLTIWDSAGQERYRTMSPIFYRVAHAVILVYDVTSRDSFEQVLSWIQEAESNTTYNNIVKLLVGNKIDLDQRVISREEGENFAKERGMIFIETSAYTNDGIDQAFEEVTYKILESDSLSETGRSIKTGVTDTITLQNGENSSNHESNEGGYCCYG